MPDRDARRIGRRILQPLQLRHVPLGWIVQRQFAGVAELQDRHGREALRHRRDTENRVAIDWTLRRQFAESRDARMSELAVDDDAPGGAGYVRLFRKITDD